MTRQDGLDLSGVNLYNENGGVVQGQICGQGLITKLLRNKKTSKGGAVPLAAQNSLLSVDGEAGTTMCMNPVAGVTKRTRLHRSHMYENMNMLSNDTESCSSDEKIISETTSSGSLSAALDDLQAPSFVAQFDPMQLFDPNATEQEHVSASATRKLGSSWSASLPAVLEEDSKDSQSEQDSQTQVQGHGGIWRNILTPTLAVDEEDESSSVGDDDDTRLGQKQVLLESDRIKSPISIPRSASKATQFQLDQKKIAEQEGKAAAILPKTPASGWNKNKTTKQAKEESMREAIDRRIKQVMEEEFGQGAGAEGSTGGLASDEFQKLTSGAPLDEDDDDEEAPEESPSQDGQTTFVHFPGIFDEPDSSHHCLEPESDELHPADVSAQMQDMLRQQQVTLKEMSLQNYQYRKELSDCQEMFGKWRLEKEKQQSTISDLVKEKEAYASEANFLRNEMSSIRHELEALRKEAQLHSGIQNHRQKQSPYKDSSPARQDSKSRTNEYQSNQSPNPSERSQHRESPFKDGSQKQPQSPYKDSSRVRRQQETRGHTNDPQRDQNHRHSDGQPQQQSPFKDESQKQQQSPYKESSRVRHQQETRGRSDDPQRDQNHRHLDGQPQQQSPFKGASQKQQQSPYKESSHVRHQPETRGRSDKPQRDQQHRHLHGQPQQSPFKGDSQALPAGAISPPPPSKTILRGTPPRLDYIGANKPDKPLISKLKKTTPDSAKRQSQGRSVKFHDPPKNKEWTLFPSQMEDDRLNTGMLEGQTECPTAPQSRDSETDHRRESAYKRDEPMVVRVHPNEADAQVDVQDEEPTPIAANGRSAMAAGESRQNEASPNVYKNRLETIQRNRQQRVARDNKDQVTGSAPGSKNERMHR